MPLQYSRTAPRAFRWLTPRVLRRLAVAAGVAVALCCAVHVLMYWKLYEAKVRLGRVPGVGDVQVHGFMDGYSYKAMAVTVTLEGRPLDRITFHGIPSGAGEEPYLCLNALGPVSFEVETGQYSSSEIELGTAGEFGDLVAPLRVSSVEDVVTRYDALVAVLTAAPPAGTFVGPSGTTYSYSIHLQGRDWI